MKIQAKLYAIRLEIAVSTSATYLTFGKSQSFQVSDCLKFLAKDNSQSRTNIPEFEQTLDFDLKFYFHKELSILATILSKFTN